MYEDMVNQTNALIPVGRMPNSREGKKKNVYYSIGSVQEDITIKPTIITKYN